MNELDNARVILTLKTAECLEAHLTAKRTGKTSDVEKYKAAKTALAQAEERVKEIIRRDNGK